MSARSHCVTCGIVAHAALRCSAVLRRTARIGCRSTLPQREKSGQRHRSRRAAAPAPLVDQPLGVRLHVLDRNPSARPAAVHFADLDAELARRPAHRRRRRRGRRFRRRGGVRRPPARPRADVDDVGRRDRPGAQHLRRLGRRIGSFTPALSGCRSSDPAPRRRAAARSLPSIASTAAGAGRLFGRPRSVRPSPGFGRQPGFRSWLSPSLLLAVARSSARSARARRRPRTLRIAWPTLTLSPALTLISFTVPATDEGTSIVALSVSSSRTGCSLAMVSPGLDQHAQDVACFDLSRRARGV